MIERSLVLKLVAGVVVLAGVGAGAAVYTVGTNYEQPTVRSIDTEFGTVTRETAAIDTRVVVFNPNNQSLPGSTRIRYAVSLNDVQVATGTRTGVNLEPGLNVVNLSTEMDNSRVPAWWATHVNGGERTVMTTRPTVSYSGLPFGFSLPAHNRTIETDLLATLSDDRARSVGVANSTLLNVSGQTASWGNATARRSPVEVSSRLTNRHDEPVRIAGTAYVVEMNGIVVGEGRTNESLRLAPGETATYATSAVIDTQRMQAWWASHLRRNQTTRLHVRMYALARDDGDLERVPLAMYDRRALVRTDMLGSGETSVELLPTETPTVRGPTVGTPESDWGAVEEGYAEIETTVPVDNPAEEFGGFLDVNVAQTTTINGVTVADGEATAEDLPAGESAVEVTSRMAHDTVPEWWARHVNGGERSTVRTETNGSVDVGVTTLDLALDDTERTLRTDALAGFESEEDREVTVDGRTAVAVTETDARWGEATPETAPVVVSVTMENRQPRTVTVRDVNYTVRLNDVVLADDTCAKTITLGPYERTTVDLTLSLNNSKMAAWWPTHVRNDERSRLRTESYATVVSGGRTERVKFDALGSDSTITTNVLVDRNATA